MTKATHAHGNGGTPTLNRPCLIASRNSILRRTRYHRHTPVSLVRASGSHRCTPLRIHHLLPSCVQGYVEVGRRRGFSTYTPTHITFNPSPLPSTCTNRPHFPTGHNASVPSVSPIRHLSIGHSLPQRTQVVQMESGFQPFAVLT
jgi:hypothetical protein